jgi:nitroreductase
MMDSASIDRTKFLRGLRAVREFTTEPVSDEVVNDILEVGRWTSTAGNRQGTEVVVIRDPTVKQKLGDWGAKPAANAAVVFLLVTVSDAGVLDEGRMAERLALAARAHGLGSIVNTLKNDGPAEVKKLLGIPEDSRTVAVVPIGNIDREARRALPKNPNGGRKPLEQYAHEERF